MAAHRLVQSLQRGLSSLRTQGRSQRGRRRSRDYQAPAAVLAPAKTASERPRQPHLVRSLPPDWVGHQVSSAELISGMVPRAQLLQKLSDLHNHAEYPQTEQFPSASQLDDLQQKLRHWFTNPMLLKLSLVHTSASTAGNHNLAWVGDAAMHLIVSEQLCARYFDANINIGDLTIARAQLISRSTFAAQAQVLGLAKMAVVGKGVRSSGPVPLNLLAEMFESIMGAIYVDAGLERCRASYLHLCPMPKSFFELKKRLKL
ncbi:hypothetical protein WJX73_008665 [Symbiochloris irregularis]|uniref:RNase III domain-containing protein n=1 Tax=Symbiochloris irregularis TaxID=706552 RepID=A0AAW1Q0F2_9CHLO